MSMAGWNKNGFQDRVLLVLLDLIDLNYQELNFFSVIFYKKDFLNKHTLQVFEWLSSHFVKI
jgi:hypothetical protein